MFWDAIWLDFCYIPTDSSSPVKVLILHISINRFCSSEPDTSIIFPFQVPKNPLGPGKVSFSWLCLKCDNVEIWTLVYNLPREISNWSWPMSVWYCLISSAPQNSVVSSSGWSIASIGALDFLGLEDTVFHRSPDAWKCIF